KLALDVLTKAREIEIVADGQCCHSRSPIGVRDFDAEDRRLLNARILVQDLLNLIRRHIFALPAKGISEAIDETHPPALVKLHEIARIEIIGTITKRVPDDLFLGFFLVEIALKTVELGDLPDEDALFARLRLDGVSIRVSLDRCLARRFREEDVVVTLKPSHHAGNAVDIHEPHIALGGAVKLDDFGNAEALLKIGPDLGSKARAENRLDAMRALLRMGRSVVQVAAKFAHIDEMRRLKTLAIIPMARGRKLSPHHTRRTSRERSPPPEHDAARMIHGEPGGIDDLVRRKIEDEEAEDARRAKE